jgi:hypothetical protein
LSEQIILRGTPAYFQECNGLEVAYVVTPNCAFSEILLISASIEAIIISMSH